MRLVALLGGATLVLAAFFAQRQEMASAQTTGWPTYFALTSLVELRRAR